MGVSVGVHAGLVSRRTHVVLSSRGRHASLRPHHMILPAGHKKTTFLFQIKRRRRRRKKKKEKKNKKSQRKTKKKKKKKNYAQNTNTTIMYKFCPDLMSDQFTSARSRARRGTGAWGPSLSGAQRAARGGTCPAWHRQASDQDQRPHRAPDLKKNKK